MPIIARGTDDLLLDYYVTKLTTFAAAQKLISAAVAFTVERDYPDNWDITVPLVNLRLESDAIEPKGSSARSRRGGKLTFVAECFAPLVKSRLYYLKAQALTGLFSNLDGLPDLGQAKGSIASVSWPSWSFFKRDTNLQEDDLYWGAWTWDVTTAWIPDETTFPDLAAVHIAVLDKWSADYSL